MEPSKACIDLIRTFEGLELEAYLCPAGIPTIGYGHTRGVKLGQTITRQLADALLEQDIDEVAALVSRIIQVQLTQGQFDAVASFAFNCEHWIGSTLVRKVNQGDFAGAAQEFPKWNHAGGKVLDGLTRRRTAEQLLFLGLSA